MFPGEITYLLDRAAGFGNHYRKYIQAIRDIFPLLPDSLWKDDSSVTVAFTFPGKNYFRDMKHLKALTNDRRLCLNFLGCYYAVQFLWLNVFMSDWFDYQLDKTRSPQNVYRQFILTLGNRFRRLSAVYMHFLIEILKEDRQLPRFVITGVGTRSDQDDIDVGIIDDGSESRQWLNRVIGKMNLEMTRFASHFHFHLSEHVGNQAYSASIPEYRNLLQERIGSFVILTEMLGAAFIVGDKSLFIEFEQKVTDRYFYRRKPNRFHEGYLRGILGEIIDLAAEPFDEYRINPKQDGLRIIKNVVYAYKTRLNIREVNPWRILREIKRAYPGLRKEFRILENSLTFLEIFRYLYQQLVVQEETITIGDGAIRQNLQEIAYQLGYRDFGPHQAVHHLLQDYRNAVQEYRSVLPVLIRDLSAHLKENSVLREVILPRRSPDHSVLDLLE
ncbi:MAG TPA: hypothetical protein ENK14_00855, partial [Caldithrix sp.]|nr:hypothetical protein [Caldithrix sp.]